MLCAIVLAAGASTRMGTPKPLLSIGSGADVFVTRLIGTMRGGGADDVVVVLGAHADQVRAAIERQNVDARIVENRDYERGQLSSLVAALAAIDRPGLSGLMVIPVDMPLVTVATVRAIVDGWRRGGHPVVRPANGSRHGHPVIFDRKLFDELRSADLSVGARAVVAAHADAVLDIPIADPGAYIDIDTPEDYERYIVGRMP